MERCENCKFHRMIEDGKNTYITCHRFPPFGCVADVGDGIMAISVFPKVEECDWCGEYIRDPEIIAREIDSILHL
jgi:hypothetical protein